MKHCSKCNITTIDKNNNCALCGKTLQQDSTQEVIEYYPQYPLIADKKNSIISILEKVSLLALIVCIAVDLFVTKSVSWSMYVLSGMFLILAVVLRAIEKKNNLAKFLSRLTFYLTLYILFLELYTGSFGWGMQYTIPFMLLGFSITAGVATIAKGYVDFEMFKPMFVIAFLSIINFVALICILATVLWPALCSVLVALVLIAFMFMFRFKRSIRSIKRDFGI